MLSKRQAAFELIFAGVLWGFGFVATIWALETFSTPEVLVYRFLIAAVGGELLALIFRQHLSRSDLKKHFLKSAPAGLILAAMMIFQTWGLEYTTATKAGFLTSLYVIFVPLMNSWFFQRGGNTGNYFRAALAILGTLILMDVKISEINLGDIFLIICSLFATLHIIYIGTVTHSLHRPFRFNNFQSFWCLMGLLPFLFWQKNIHLEFENLKAWMGILALALGSSVVAFYIQIRTQRVLSDSTASMIFLLESPFAALFGFLILSERLSLFQTSGALIIMLASVLQILSERGTKTTEVKAQSRYPH